MFTYNRVKNYLLHRYLYQGVECQLLKINSAYLRLLHKGQQTAATCPMVLIVTSKRSVTKKRGLRFCFGQIFC